MNIDNIKWETLNGGYKIPYDVSIPLSRLEEATNEELINSIFKELWDNLHHQGDVGLASYYSVPRLVNICILKKSFECNYIGLCLLIEHRRQSDDNPAIPKQLEQDYFESLNALGDYLLQNFKSIKDKISIQQSLALFATLSGEVKLGKVIANSDENSIVELLNEYGW